jgi:hypothetical protein
MVYQYAFIVLFNGIVGAPSPLPRSPMLVGPFAADCSTNALTMCNKERDQLLANFPHSRLVVDCFPTDPK